MRDAESREPALTIDLSGLLCPKVVLELARTVRANPNVRHFDVVSTDPLSTIDIPVYAARNGLAVTMQPASETDRFSFRLDRSALAGPG